MLVLKDFKIFYIEKEDSWWTHRISCKIPFSYLKQIYLLENPYRIEIYGNHNELTFSINNKKWKSEQSWMKELLFMIEQNKK